jgi:hypothetical protein
VLVLLVLLPVLLLLLLLQLLELLFPKGACVVTLLPTNVASTSVARVTTDVVAANVANAVGVIITTGSLCYYISTNQQSRNRGLMYPREVLSLFLTLSLSCAKTRSFSLVQRPPPRRPFSWVQREVNIFF